MTAEHREAFIQDLAKLEWIVYQHFERYVDYRAYISPRNPRLVPDEDDPIYRITVFTKILYSDPFACVQTTEDEGFEVVLSEDEAKRIIGSAWGGEARRINGGGDYD
jgi:hypothetical protein